MFGGRKFLKVLSAPFAKRHYIALINMVLLYPDFLNCFRRYLFFSGDYPAKIKVRSQLGCLMPTLYAPDDMLTLNEIFCRMDYRVPKNTRVVVDIGANIGLSALYFLTSDPEVVCYLYEPVPQNVARLKRNLEKHEGRFFPKQKAVDIKSGRARFGVESTGRYGGLLKNHDEFIEVECVEINGVLSEILRKQEKIDLVKIDTEGTEVDLVQAIKPEYLEKIGAIVFEGYPEKQVLSSQFRQKQYGSICRLEKL